MIHGFCVFYANIELNEANCELKPLEPLALIFDGFKFAEATQNKSNNGTILCANPDFCCHFRWIKPA